MNWKWKSHVAILAAVAASATHASAMQVVSSDPLEIPAIRAFLGDDGFGEPHPDAPPELEQFGRLAGLWRVEQEVLTQSGQWRSETPALWAWQYTLGGFATSDLWYQGVDALPQYMSDLGRDYMLTAIRIYDVKSDQWKVAWGANGNGKGPGVDFGTFEAVASGDGVEMRNAGDDPVVGLQRVVFSEVTRESFRWRSDYSQDGGENWITVMRLSASRIK